VKKYLNIEIIMTGIILLGIGILAINGLVVQKLSSRAMAFPIFVFSVAGVVGVLEIIRCVRIVNRSQAHKTSEASSKKEVVLENKKNFFEIVVMIVLYFVFMCLVGFIPASLFFSVVYAIRQKYKKIWLFCIVSMLIIVGWYFLFDNLLGVTFPKPLLMNWRG
jgi:Na+/melibiose symporter-like transporter